MESSIHEAIYHNFERELSRAIEYIYVDDDQQNTYSIENAALVLKIGAEIESIAKAICENNGNHESSHKFDENCIKSSEHKIDKVAIIGDDFHFTNVSNTIFRPFVKDEKKWQTEQMTYSWNNAYQNIKHGKIECVKTFGTIRYILRALGTLYVLNYELSGKTVYSRFFAYVSGDKIIGQTGGLVWDKLIELTPEQKEFLNEQR